MLVIVANDLKFLNHRAHFRNVDAKFVSIFGNSKSNSFVSVEESDTEDIGSRYVLPQQRDENFKTVPLNAKQGNLKECWVNVSMTHALNQ